MGEIQLNHVFRITKSAKELLKNNFKKESSNETLLQIISMYLNSYNQWIYATPFNNVSVTFLTSRLYDCSKSDFPLIASGILKPIN